MAACYLRSPVRLGPVLHVHLLGRSWAGAAWLGPLNPGLVRIIGRADMLAAKIVLVVAGLNLLFLASELAMNVVLISLR